MNVLASVIHQRFLEQGIITGRMGPDMEIRRFAPIEDCAPGDLVFVDHAKYLERVRELKPSAVVTTSALAIELEAQSDLAILIAPNVRLAIALLKQVYADRDLRTGEWPRVHPTAVIHTSTNVPDDVHIGPGAVVGANVCLGNAVVVMANVVIE
jgi:UDP-3-O-[3-hydroxymyristoyl] glucosamine N-acyltransferase